ncbi:signal peptidase II [Patescibacteria group bacterium]|nr:signal peptidase II [Patescibacteria group bacterium]
MKQSNTQKLTTLALVVVLLTTLDQWVKTVLGWLEYRDFTWGAIKFVWYKNPGIAFSIPLPSPIAIALIVSLIIFLIVLFWRSEQWGWYRIGLLLTISGGFSNLWDKISLGYVRDFISISWLPIFNLADVIIFIGIITVFIGLTYAKNQKI